MLILTEKPSVARAFAEALKVPKKDGYWENDGYCIVNALGHLLEIFLPEDYDPSLKTWSQSSLPVIPEKFKYKIIAKTKDRLAVIKNCFNRRKNDPLLIATDAEREGELISAEILEYVGFKNYSEAKRFWVSEALTPEVIVKGMKNAKPLADYYPYRDQGYARQRADWLVGMNLTRLLSLKSGKLLHFGRVQTAVLRAVYEREKSIAEFTSEFYFEIVAVLQGNNPFTLKLINPDNEEFPARFSETSDIISSFEKIKNGLKSALITEIDKKVNTVCPPRLFNLTALQKEAHKKFSYSPEQTLNIAQALYENHKCLSYPRTPSNVMGDDNVSMVTAIYNKLISAYKGTPLEIIFKDSDPSLINAENKRLFNSEDLQDHHALIPLSPLPADCSIEETNIYKLVFERFFTLLKKPYIYNSVSVAADISGHSFTGKGIEVLQTGWKTEQNDDEDETVSEDFSGIEKNKNYPVVSVDAVEKKTEPKKHYTFSALLQLMENPRNEEKKRLVGLGTPATRGSILQKLVDRKYISLNKKNILITEDGVFLIENIFKNENLTTFTSIPETTRWEEQLHQDTESFLNNVIMFVRNAVKNTDMTAYRHEKISLGKCPLCGGDIYEGKNNYYCGNYNTEKLCNFKIYKEICGAAITSSEIKTLLDGKKTKIKKCEGKSGKAFNASFILSKEGKIEFVFENSK